MHSSLGRFVRLEIKTNVLKTSLIAVLGWGLIPIVFTLTPQNCGRFTRCDLLGILACWQC